MTKERLLALISLHHAVNDGAILVIAAILPALMKSFDFDLAAVGTLVSVSLLVTIVFQTLAGKYSDRCHPGFLLAMGFLLMSFSMLVLTRITSFTGLLLSMMLLRVGSSVYHPVGISWLTRRYEGPPADRALGIQSAFGNIGVIAAMFTSGALAEWGGWTLPPYIWAGLCLGVCLINLAFIGAQIRPLPADQIAQPAPDRAPAPAVPPSTNPLHGLLWAIFPSIIAGGMFTVVTNFGPIYLTAMPGASLSLAGMAIGVAWLGTGTITAIFYGRLRERLTRRQILLGVLAWTSVTIFLFGCAPGFWTAVFLLFSNGLALFMAYPVIQSYIAGISEKGSRGQAFGYFFSLQLVGATAISYLSGYLGHWFYPGAPFILMGVLSLIGTVYFYYFGPR